MQDKINKLKSLIKSYPDFPKPGILFRDIFSVFQNAEGTQLLKEVMTEYVKKEIGPVDVIIGLEARGFLIGPLLANEFKVSFVPIRKKGKLPGDLVTVNYSLEYGTDTFEMQKNSIQKDQRVLIVDDLLATGGSLGAAIKMVENANAKVAACFVIMELEELKGRDKLPVPKKDIHTLIKF